MLIKHQFPADGEYTFKVKGVTGYFQAVLGGVKGEQLEVTVDGERVKLFDWDKEIANTTGNGKCDAAHPGQGRPAHGRRHVPRHQRRAGHRAEPAVPADDEHAGLDPGIPVLSARRPGADRRARTTPRAPTDTASRRKIFVCRPATPRARKTPARARIISTLAQARVPPARARRRTSTSLMEFYQAGRNEGGSFDDGHRGGAAAHPRRSGVHLSRRARAGRRWRPGKTLSRSAISALASRLSFFLWSSIPDDELLDAGGAGQAQGSGRARAAGAADAGGSEVRGADRATSPASG